MSGTICICVNAGRRMDGVEVGCGNFGMQVREEERMRDGGCGVGREDSMLQLPPYPPR